MLSHRSSADPDDGSVLVLVIGYTAIAALLITVGVDVSKVFLARRALASAADSAALAAAQGIDTSAIYRGGALRCGEPLPLDPTHAAALADRSVSDDADDLGHVFATVEPPDSSVYGGTVTVTLVGRVAVPFGRVLTWLDGSAADGEVGVSETSHARSPVAGGLC